MTWKGRPNRDRNTANGGEVVESDAFGLVRPLNSGCGMVSRSAQEYPYLTKLMNAWAKNIPGIDDVGWTAITLIRKWAAHRHRDRNNVGLSMMVSLGKHRGGELMSWPPR